MKNTIDWEAEAKGILKGLMARDGVTFRDLEHKLKALGVIDSNENLSNKVGRGKFSFVFFLQCVTALGINEVDLGIAKKLNRSS